MKTTITSIVIMASVFLVAVTQANDKAYKALKQQAEQCAKIMIDRDYDSLAKYTHPKLIKASGGEDRMIAMVKATISQMESQGMELNSAEIGKPKPITKAGASTLISIVPQSVTMKTQGKTLKVESFLLGVSEDKGASWRFIDLSNLNEAQFKANFPEYAKYFRYPKKKKPYLID